MAREVLLELLQEVPFIQVVEQRHHEVAGVSTFEVRLRWPGGETTLVCEVRESGQPAPAKEAIAALEARMTGRGFLVGVLIAPYISKKVADLCAERKIGTVDLSGNARLSFGNVLIDRSGRPNRFSESRELRSLFGLKSCRVLRVMLEHPERAWQVQTIAKEAQVSLGLASSVKQMLANMDWLVEPSTVKLKHPEEVLTKWVGQEPRFAAESAEFYTKLSADELSIRLGKMCEQQVVEYALSGLSAAWRQAPMVKPSRTTAYVEGDLSRVAAALELKAVPSGGGGNVVLLRPRDRGVFYQAAAVGDCVVTCPVQTFLDCMLAGGRGEEAAAAVMDQKLRPRW